ncbi:class I tRNA ligase family protein, partial [Candidatus Peregrinibacteria bacterium]|nr:class I tRNA ligase family protein [Candidatus Peregrinibacteria bacterium]
SAGTKIYDFIWSLYCDWYLEISKGEFKNPAVLLHVLKTVLKLIHPFVPFVTEAIWQHINKSMLINESWPVVNKKLIFPQEAKAMELIHGIISEIRRIRAEAKVEPVKKIHAIIHAGKYIQNIEKKREIITRLARLESLEILKNGPKPKDAKTALVEGIELYLPLKDMLDLDKEKKRLETEIKTKADFITGLERKLKNKDFIDKAPKEIIARDINRLNSEKDQLLKLAAQLKTLR